MVYDYKLHFNQPPTGLPVGAVSDVKIEINGFF